MAADLSTGPSTGLNVQLCGDAHLSNFGGFASPERDLVFDINDFDETAVGPFEWDLKRLATSLEVAGRELGYSGRRLREIVLQGVRTYRHTIRLFAHTSKLDTWYARLDVPTILERWGSKAGTNAVKNFQRAVAKAESKDRLRARDKLTTVVDGTPRFLSDPPLLVPVEDVYSEPDEAVQVEQAIEGALRSYRSTLSPDRRHLLSQYRYVALARTSGKQDCCDLPARPSFALPRLHHCYTARERGTLPNRQGPCLRNSSGCTPRASDKRLCPVVTLGREN